MSSETESFSIRSSFPKWFPLISTLLLAGVTYGVQRTALSLYAENLSNYDLFQSGDNLTDFLIFLQIASTIIAYGLTKGISGFLSASVSKRYKRKNTMRFGLTLLVIGSISLAFGKWLWALILGNLFIGSGLGFFFTTSMSALTEIAGAEGSAFSLGSMEFSVYLGSSIGAFFAGLIGENQNFAASFIFAQILLDSTRVETRWSFRNIFRTPTLLLSYFAGHFSRIMDSIIVLILPIMLSSVYAFNPTRVGLVTSGFTLAWALSMPVMGRLSDRFGRKEATFIGLLIEGTSLILLTFVESFSLVFILAILAGIGTSAYYPSLPSITRDVVPIVKREKSLGIYRSTLDSGYFTGPLIAIGLVYAATNLTLWGSSSQDQLGNMLKFPFLIIGGVLCIISLLFILLARETRPGWIQASYSLKHGEKVKEVFYRLQRTYNSYLKGNDIRYCTKLLNESKELEREADDIVFEVSQALYSNVRTASDDYHFMKLTTILDSSIGFVLKSFRKLILVPREKLSDNFVDYLAKELNLLCQLIEKAIEALEVVCIQPLASHPIFKSVHKIENSLDKNAQIGLSDIIANPGELSTVETFLIIHIIEDLENSANTIEDAVDVMKILGLKHQISPIII